VNTQHDAAPQATIPTVGPTRPVIAGPLQVDIASEWLGAAEDFDDDIVGASEDPVLVVLGTFPEAATRFG